MDIRRKYLLLILIVTLVVFLRLFSGNKLTIFNSLTTSIENSKEKQHVFFDFGANNGDSIVSFLTKQDKPRTIVDSYGAKNNVKWKIYAFEANHMLNKDLLELKEKCEKNGHTFYLYKESAVWIRNEKLTFYLDTVNKYKNYHGSSLREDHPDVVKNKSKVEVDGIDVAQIIKKYSIDDEIIVKIDIEGSEYELLDHFVKNDVFKYIDIITIEFHRNPWDPNKVKEQFYLRLFELLNITYTEWY